MLVPGYLLTTRKVQKLHSITESKGLFTQHDYTYLQSRRFLYDLVNLNAIDLDFFKYIDLENTYVSEFEKKYTEGVELPPVVVKQGFKGKLLVVDGRYRLKAQCNLKIQEIAAVILQHKKYDKGTPYWKNVDKNLIEYRLYDEVLGSVVKHPINLNRKGQYIVTLDFLGFIDDLVGYKEIPVSRLNEGRDILENEFKKYLIREGITL